MFPKSTGPDDHDRTEIGLVYQLFEVLSVVQDGWESETIKRCDDRKSAAPPDLQTTMIPMQIRGEISCPCPLFPRPFHG